MSEGNIHDAPVQHQMNNKDRRHTLVTRLHRNLAVQRGENPQTLGSVEVNQATCEFTVKLLTMVEQMAAGLAAERFESSMGRALRALSLYAHTNGTHGLYPGERAIITAALANTWTTVTAAEDGTINAPVVEMPDIYRGVVSPISIVIAAAATMLDNPLAKRS